MSYIFPVIFFVLLAVIAGFLFLNPAQRYRCLDTETTGQWSYKTVRQPFSSTTEDGCPLNFWQEKTPFLDKKGKEIWEGDLVVFDADRGKIYTIIHKDSRFLARHGLSTENPEDIELRDGMTDIEVQGYAYPSPHKKL